MAAQHLDVGIDGAVLAVIVIVPDLLQDLFAAQRNALVADQKTSRSNSFGVNDASCPATFTLWLAVSMDKSPKV